MKKRKAVKAAGVCALIILLITFCGCERTVSDQNNDSKITEETRGVLESFEWADLYSPKPNADNTSTETQTAQSEAKTSDTENTDADLSPDTENEETKASDSPSSLFIGDSRTTGLSMYNAVDNATYFASTGMSVYHIFTEEVSVPEIGKTNLDGLLSKKQFDKIYIMLGINELGYDLDKTSDKFSDLLAKVKEAQPSAKIIIEANLHVTTEKSRKDKLYNNTNIDNFNSKLIQFVDNTTVFYIDINSVFDDENGGLTESYTTDGLHPTGKYYRQWSEWISTQNIG